MNDLFIHYLQISLQTSFFALIVWILFEGFLKKKCSAQSVLLIWAIIFVRLSIPWNFEIQTNSFNDSHYNEQEFIYPFSKRVLEPVFEPEFDLTLPIFLQQEFSTTPDRIEASLFSFSIAHIWGLGFLIIVCFYLWKFWTLSRLIERSSVEIDKQVFEIYQSLILEMGLKKQPLLSINENVHNAAIVGLFSPQILISPKLIEECCNEEIRSVLAHELYHFKEKHLLIHYVGLFVCAVHWFNPLIWILRGYLKRGIELACDERVVQNSTGSNPQTYAHHLLNLTQRLPFQNLPGLGYIGLFNRFNHKFITQRIVMITKSSERKIPLFMVTIFTLLGIAAASTDMNRPPDPLPDLRVLQLFKEKYEFAETGVDGVVALKKIPTGKVACSLIPGSSWLGVELKSIQEDERTAKLNYKGEDFDVSLVAFNGGTYTNDQRFVDSEFARLNLGFEAVSESNFSSGAKAFLKKKITPIIQKAEACEVLDLLKQSPYAVEGPMQFLIGNYHLQTKELDAAEVAYINAINTGYTSNSSKNLAIIYLVQNEYDKAEIILEKMLSVHDSIKPDQYLYLGICKMEKENYPRAISLFKTALDQNDSSIKSSIQDNLFKCYLAVEDWDGAELILEEMLRDLDDPERLVNHYMNLGYLAETKSDFRRAKSAYNNALLLTNNSETKVKLESILATL